MRSNLFRRQDFILIFICLLVAAALFLWFSFTPSGGVALIEQDGREIGRYPLSQIKENQTLRLTGDVDVEILLEPGAVSFYSSTCPDQICVRTGKLTKPGEAAVCLPARVSIRILSPSGESEIYDGITG